MTQYNGRKLSLYWPLLESLTTADNRLIQVLSQKVWYAHIQNTLLIYMIPSGLPKSEKEDSYIHIY